jgi:hypothetical protein
VKEGSNISVSVGDYFSTMLDQSMNWQDAADVRKKWGKQFCLIADAAYLIFTKPAKSFTGQFLIDDTFLAGEGVTDFDVYRVDPSQPLSPDFFVPDSSKPPPGVSLAAKA